MQVTIDSGGRSTAAPAACAAPTRVPIINQGRTGIDRVAIATQIGHSVAGARIIHPELAIWHNVGIGIVPCPTKGIGGTPIR